jgi:HEPN domain-containing protein
MVPKESFTPGAWFKRGDIDLKSAKILLREGALEVAAFHIQQSLEKYLKGFLLSKGWRLRKVHELDVLLNDAI